MFQCLNSLGNVFLRTLEPDEVRKAAAYCKKSSEKAGEKWKEPQWRNEYNCGKGYKPSYNIAPTDVTPVLVSAAHFDFDDDDEDLDYKELSEFTDENNTESDSEDKISSEDRLLVPMMWQMIPFWHNRNLDHRKHGLTTNNCRLESMLESKLYKHAFNKGQRCVVLCEGFYEWQTTDPKATKPSERAAYYIYVPQNNGIQIENIDSVRKSVENLKLLKMAGLFDIWTNADGEQIFSYSVITLESDDKLGWMHHRSPAILESEQDVDDWLDFKRVTDAKHLLSLLKPPKMLQWHRVSNIVNNSRNKSDQCNKPIDMDKKPTPKKNKLMESWLVMKKPKKDDDDNDGDVSDKKV